MPLDPSAARAHGAPWMFSTVRTPRKMHATPHEHLFSLPESDRNILNLKTVFRILIFTLRYFLITFLSYFL